jgi:WD repeat-containing protein 45
MKGHEGSLRCMCLSRDGRLLATTSDTGTIIRVFDASPSSSGKQLYEFRRGTDPAEIFSMAFSPGGKFLVVNSDKFDAHVFAVTQPELNETSKLGGWGLGAYMSSVWSATRIALPEVTSTVAFTSEREIAVVCYDRSYYLYELSEAEGRLFATRKGYTQLGRAQ